MTKDEENLVARAQEVWQNILTREAAVPQPPSERGGRAITITVAADIAGLVKDPELVRELVLDFAARDDMGFKKHKQNLEVGDGRDTEYDLYQELLDAVQYNKKAILENDPATGIGHFYVEIYERLIELVAQVKHQLLARPEYEDAMDFKDCSRRTTNDSDNSGCEETSSYQRFDATEGNSGPFPRIFLAGDQ